MNRMVLVVSVAVVLPLSAAEPPGAEDRAASERGHTALTTRAFNPTTWTLTGYQNAWKSWQPARKEAPADYAPAFREYYGLHPAPFENNGLPMGLRETKSLLLGKTVSYDCMLCHAGSILGKSYIGLGNAALDIQALFEDLGKESTFSVKNTPFPFSNVRGTTEAGSAAVFLLAFREPDLSLRLRPLDLGLRPNLCEDTPAWWLLKKKKTMYHTGTAHARSVRSIMQFMLAPTNSAAVFAQEEPTFKDIQAYLLSLEAPKYPFPINQDLASQGQKVFAKTCAQCHGKYGADWSYPNKIVDIDVIGTDRTRLEGFSAKLGEHYNKSWFAREKGEDGYKFLPALGYQAPPLDGVWATAPYLHNASVPTLYNLLNSKSRPKIFTRSFKTGEEDFDRVKVGWKVQTLDKAPDASLPAHERRQVYDTSQPGRGNQGHTFGDDLTEEQRRAVIEYLKTL
jgi:mono/diheme cytochrome c family protein